MKKFLFLLFVLFSFKTFSQDLNDRIFTKEGDSILCKITEVQTNWIYYDHKGKKGISNDYIHKDDIKYYLYNGEAVRLEKKSNTASTQKNTSDSILIKKSLGTIFIQNNKRLNAQQLLEITKLNPEAYKEMKIANSHYIMGTVLGIAGGVLVGFPLGTAIAGAKPNWTIAGIGAGLIFVSIPFSTSYMKHAKNAVGIYNNGLKQIGFRKIDFNLGLTCNGIGVKITF